LSLTRRMVEQKPKLRKTSWKKSFSAVSKQWKNISSSKRRGWKIFLHSFLNNTNFTLGVLNSKIHTYPLRRGEFMHAKIAKARTVFYVFLLMGSAETLQSRFNMHIIRLMPL
jgi:hypothetical protein